MKVETYVFQSPYPSAVQVGRPDPLSQSKEDLTTSEDASLSVETKTQTEAKAYMTQVKSTASLNIATSLSDVEVSNSLEAFSRLNAQTQASQAYIS